MLLIISARIEVLKKIENKDLVESNFEHPIQIRVVFRHPA